MRVTWGEPSTNLVDAPRLFGKLQIGDFRIYGREYQACIRAGLDDEPVFETTGYDFLHGFAGIPDDWEPGHPYDTNLTFWDSERQRMLGHFSVAKGGLYSFRVPLTGVRAVRVSSVYRSGVGKPFVLINTTLNRLPGVSPKGVPLFWLTPIEGSASIAEYMVNTRRQKNSLLIGSMGGDDDTPIYRMPDGVTRLRLTVGICDQWEPGRPYETRCVVSDSEQDRVLKVIVVKRPKPVKFEVPVKGVRYVKFSSVDGHSAFLHYLILEDSVAL